MKVISAVFAREGVARGAAGKVAVFGLLKRGGKVYTAIIPNAKTDTLLPIIREVVTPDSIVYTDYFTSYNALDVSEFYHRRINHSKLFARGKNHINGIENFWNQAKRHMRKFNGRGCSRLANLLGCYNEDKSLQIIEETAIQAA